MNYDQMCAEIDSMVEEFLQGATEVRAEQVGLDPRAAYRLYITRDHIIAESGEDRTLQYYGGFEYVNQEYRRELGDYVFYSREDSRVDRHLSQFFDSGE
jgi:hypothetical protein